MRLVVQLQCLLAQEGGQDLVEYALVIALIAFGSASGMRVLATAINNEFTTISSVLQAAMA
jgi:pilus assembly protein Flp/PilA